MKIKTEFLIFVKTNRGCSSDAEASSENCSIGVIYGYVKETGYQRITESEALEPGIGDWILLNNVIYQAELRVEVTGGF
ncbi:MAG: hypothetical protein JSV50_05915 [Desulfobacteraceae bacterium]|nr:MAG: hypothetical protein JSV50_05915 [Desulfobacteraceae bacterium]